jgi:uncharacterized protein
MLLMLACGITLAANLRPLRGAEPPGPPPEPGPPQVKDYSPFPPPDTGYVTDLADVLSLGEEEQIEKWLWDAEEDTGFEMAVVTIESVRDYVPAPAGRSTRAVTDQDIEGFAADMFNAYGIGNMPRNDGVLLLVAVKNRKTRIELGAGYGRSRDADAVRIMQDVIIPRFRREQYGVGITEGVVAILREFADVRVGGPWGEEEGPEDSLRGFAGVRLDDSWKLLAMLGAVAAVAGIAVSLFRNGKRGWGWVFVGLAFVLVLAILRAISTVLSHIPERESSSWSSGSFGGGFAGGFGGGFGGGFSGGGGATGSW